MMFTTRLAPSKSSLLPCHPRLSISWQKQPLDHQGWNSVELYLSFTAIVSWVVLRAHMLQDHSKAGNVPVQSTSLSHCDSCLLWIWGRLRGSVCKLWIFVSCLVLSVTPVVQHWARKHSLMPGSVACFPRVLCFLRLEDTEAVFEPQPSS
jgi:hypothetical protein